MNRPIAVAAALIIAAAGLPTPAAAQRSTAPDSQAVLRAVQSAQVQFEQTRRQYMRWGNPRYGSCGIQLGRYCLGNLDFGGGDEEAWTEPVEDPAVGVARLSLIAQLDSAAGVLPGDPWIAGQPVRDPFRRPLQDC